MDQAVTSCRLRPGQVLFRPGCRRPRHGERLSAYGRCAWHVCPSAVMRNGRDTPQKSAVRYDIASGDTPRCTDLGRDDIAPVGLSGDVNLARLDATFAAGRDRSSGSDRSTLYRRRRSQRLEALAWHCVRRSGAATVASRKIAVSTDECWHISADCIPRSARGRHPPLQGLIYDRDGSAV